MASDKQINWDVSYSHIRFMEKALVGHKCVASFKRTRDIRFSIERTDDRSRVIAVLINRYTIGLADVIGVLAEFRNVNCIVAPGDWCGYTREAKDYGAQQGVAVFHASEFLGALWKDDPLTYVKIDLIGRPMYAYRSD